MPHGGPGSRDEWGFDWLVQFFTARGSPCYNPDIAGRRTWRAMVPEKRVPVGQTAIGDVNDAGRWLVSQGIARADKLTIVGWSYGGYAALQKRGSRPDLFKAIVASRRSPI
jgi:dipeptidyl aminopeptidase/acylaminoacyl peptidase